MSAGCADESTALLTTQRSFSPDNGSCNDGPSGKLRGQDSAEKLVVEIKGFLDQFSVLTLAFMLLAIGVLVCTMFAGWGFLESLYVITQIVTTVGYGDFTVSTDALRIFMVFYCLLSLFVIAYVVQTYIGNMVEFETDIIRKHVRSFEIWGDVRKDGEAAKKYGAVNKMFALGVMFVVFVIFGTVFFRFVEHCSCGLGDQAIKGCSNKDYETCAATGGLTKSTVEAFYMSVITLTTIGFGDYQPRTVWGRMVGIVWMLLGCAVTAGLIAAFAEALIVVPKTEKLHAQDVAAGINEEVFKKIDKNNDGTVSRGEFLAFCLVKYGAVDDSLVQDICGLFDRFDKNNDSRISFAEIQARCRSSRELV